MNITKTLIIPGLLFGCQAHAMEPESVSNELPGAQSLNQLTGLPESVEDCLKTLEALCTKSHPSHQQILASGFEVIEKIDGSEQEKNIIKNYLIRMAAQNTKQ